MTDPSGYAKTLALPAGFDAPRLLRYQEQLVQRHLVPSAVLSCAQGSDR
jgi:hypothetical protein